MKVNKRKSFPLELEINCISLSILPLLTNNMFHDETKVSINNIQDEDNMSEDESYESTNSDSQASYIQGD